MNTPRVQVLLPIKLPAPWLPLTLMSLSAQTFDDWKLVVVVHGQGMNIESQIFELFPDAEIVYAPEAGNLGKTLNIGLNSTTAPFIARIDSDDVAEPHRLKVQYEYFQQNPKVLAVGSSATLIDPNGEVIGQRMQVTEQSRITKILRWKSPLIHPSVMFQRHAVAEIGGYSEVATNVEDYELWLRLATIGSIGGIGQRLLRYRVHPNQVSTSRPIPPEAVRQVGQSRIALAVKTEKSVAAAHIRQSIWASRQMIRSIRRKT